MRERDLAGTRHTAAADHRDHRRRVVRAAERALLHKAAALRQKTRDAVDFRDLERLLAREARQDGTQTACEHRLAGPRHADHQQVVTARRRNLERPFCLELPLHIGEVIAEYRPLLCLRRHSRRKRFLPIEELHDLIEPVEHIDRDALDEQRLVSIAARNKDRRQPLLSRGNDHRQDAMHCAALPFQGELCCKERRLD